MRHVCQTPLTDALETASCNKDSGMKLLQNNLGGSLVRHSLQILLGDSFGNFVSSTLKVSPTRVLWSFCCEAQFPKHGRVRKETQCLEGKPSCWQHVCGVSLADTGQKTPRLVTCLRNLFERHSCQRHVVTVANYGSLHLLLPSVLETAT